MGEFPKRTYDVVETREEARGVVTLRLLSGGLRPDFTPGQFITVYFPELHVPEGKAYSISSSPDEPTLAVTVKAMGEFSNRLTRMRAGDSFVGSDPYGFFYSEEKETPLVMLAIGIGVTPFRSLMRQYLFENPAREILLCYGNRTADDIVFAAEWRTLLPRYPNVRVAHFISREPDVASSAQKGRMNAERVLERAPKSERTEYMLCGSISFVRDMWRGLRAGGIGEERIYTEAFFTN